MAPTPYALHLAEPVAVALDGLQQALNVRAAFDPATSARSFTMAMTDVGEMYFLPVLVDALTQSAPGVTLAVVSVTQASLKEDMATGRIDLAMGLLPQLQAGFFQQALQRVGGPTAKVAGLAGGRVDENDHVRRAGCLGSIGLRWNAEADSRHCRGFSIAANAVHERHDRRLLGGLCQRGQHPEQRAQKECRGKRRSTGRHGPSRRTRCSGKRATFDESIFCAALPANVVLQPNAIGFGSTPMPHCTQVSRVKLGWKANSKPRY
jgi:hypothetical protein